MTDEQTDHAADGARASHADKDVAANGAPRDPGILLADLEADVNRTEYPQRRAAVLREASQIYREAGDNDAAQRAECKAALFAFMVTPRGEQRAPGRGRFQPMYELAGKIYPHAPTFTEQHLDWLASALEESTNVIHQARYADFLWEQRQDHRYARKAIEAYQTAARHYAVNDWNDQLADALDRASELALSISDQAGIESVKSVTFDAAAALVARREHPAVRWAIDLLDTIQGFGQRLRPNEHDKILALAEAGAEFYRDSGNFHIERSFLALLPKSHEALRRPSDAIDARRRGAASFEAEALRADSNLVALNFFQDAVRAYAEVGDTAKVDEIKRRLADAGRGMESEYRTFSFEAHIPRQVLDAWIDRLLSATVDEALLVIALLPTLYPNITAVRVRAAELRQKFPLQWLVAHTVLDDAGRILGSPDTDIEREAASVAQQYAIDLGLCGLQVQLAFDRLQSERGLDAENLMQFLRRGTLIDPATLEIAAVGIERYFAEDYVSALHVLVPHLENALRNFLIPLQIATTSVRDGQTREKQLDQVLETPRLQEVFDEDLTAYLQYLLVNPLGLNLRNRIAHGLLRTEHCTRGLAQQVLHCYIVLVKFGVEQKVVETDEATPDLQAPTSD